MDKEDHIINLLNGFGSGGAEDVFLDEDGLPTDRFLQALKSDFSSGAGGSSSNINNAGRRSPPRAATVSAPSSSAIARSKVAAAALRPPPPPQPTRHNVKGHDYLMIRRPQDYSNNLSLEQHYMEQQFEDDVVRLEGDQYGADDYDLGDDYGYGYSEATGGAVLHNDAWTSAPPLAQLPSGNRTKTAAQKGIAAVGVPAAAKKRKPVVKKRTGGMTSVITTSSAPLPSLPLVAARSRTVGPPNSTSNVVAPTTRVPSSSPTAEEKFGDYADLGGAGDIDLDMDGDLAAETRSRTLRLRLQGQQNAIRALESQLAEALSHLEARNSQLAVATRQLAVLQPAAQELKRKAQAANVDKEKSVALRRDELLEKYRGQVELLQARLGEEKQARSKDAERFKTMRDYNERAKVRTRELESKGAELTAALGEVHGKLQKYRKEYKDAAAEVQALRTAINERDAEITRQRSRCDKAEAALRNATMDIERYREEIRAQRVDLHAAEDRARKAILDVELLRQRDVTRKAEIRLASMQRGFAGGARGEGGEREGDGPASIAASVAASVSASAGGVAPGGTFMRGRDNRERDFYGRAAESRPVRSSSVPVSASVASLEAKLDRQVVAESMKATAAASSSSAALMAAEGAARGGGGEAMHRKPHWINPNVGVTSGASQRDAHGARVFPLPSSYDDEMHSGMRSSNSSITSAPSLINSRSHVNVHSSMHAAPNNRDLARIGAKYGLNSATETEGDVDRPGRPSSSSSSSLLMQGLSPARGRQQQSSSFSALPGPAARINADPKSQSPRRRQFGNLGGSTSNNPFDALLPTPSSPDGSASTRGKLRASLDSLTTAGSRGGPGVGAPPPSADRSVGSVESLVKQRYERLQTLYDRVTGGKDGRARDWGDSDEEDSDEDD